MTTYARKIVRQRNHSCIVVENSFWYSPFGCQLAISQKIINNLPQDPAIPLLGIFPKDSQSHHKDMYSTMFLTALFVIARTQKQPKCPSIEEWIRKMYIYTLENYTAEKKIASKWMELENIILSEVIQTQKEYYYMDWLINGFYT